MVTREISSDIYEVYRITLVDYVYNNALTLGDYPLRISEEKYLLLRGEAEEQQILSLI